MKKIVAAVTAFLLSAVVFAVSYTNNTYQKLADEYTQKAQNAYNAGLYDLAVEYSEKAAENAALSKAYIDKMRAQTDVDGYMQKAKDAIAEAEKLGADKTAPDSYAAAKEAYANAQSAYGRQDWASAVEYAKQSLAALDGALGSAFPEFYVVRPWPEANDCYWNIAGRPYVYNNPWMWRKLYEANKDAMENPDNPNIIEPGMKIKIPRLKGESRSGVYAPSKKYGTFGAQ